MILSMLPKIPKWKRRRLVVSNIFAAMSKHNPLTDRSLLQILGYESCLFFFSWKDDTDCLRMDCHREANEMEGQCWDCIHFPQKQSVWYSLWYRLGVSDIFCSTFSELNFFDLDKNFIAPRHVSSFSFMERSSWLSDCYLADAWPAQ